MNRSFFTCIALFLLQTLCAQEQLAFQHISVANGLSQHTVYSFCQDSLGYLWIGTKDGLNKYDGHHMTIYESYSSDTTTLASGLVKSLYTDQQNCIWIGGLATLCRYSYKKDAFKRYKLPDIQPHSEVNNICADDSGIWVTAHTGEIYLYKPEQDHFLPIDYQINGKSERISIQKIIPDKEYLYIGGFDGLYRISKKTLNLEPLFIGSPLSSIHDFLFDYHKEVWLGTKEQGLVHLDANFQLLEQIKETNKPEGIAGDKVRVVDLNAQGEILVGTFYGLSVYNPATRTCRNYTNLPNVGTSLNCNSIISIYQDKNRGIWIGTSLGGANYYHPDNFKFQHYNRENNPAWLINNMVNCIACQGQHLWLGYNENGITRIDTRNGEAIHYRKNRWGEPFIPYRNLRTILPLPDGSLLLGSLFGGVIHFNPQKLHSRTYTTTAQSSLTDNRISTIYRDSRDCIWVGTYGGLFHLDIHTFHFTPFEKLHPAAPLASKEIRCMIEDSRHRFWIGTNKGLNLYDRKNGKITGFCHSPADSTSLTSNEIICIHEDAAHRLWIGTSKGVNLFREESLDFEHFPREDGLMDNRTLSIQEDNNHHIWVAHNKGLTRIIPDTRHCESFNTQNSLDEQQFLENSTAKLPDGRCLFGGIGGITLFDPHKLTQPGLQSKVIFSNLYVNNQRIRPGDNTGLLRTHIAQTTHIRLQANHRYFSLYYSFVNFTPLLSTYQYRLSGSNYSEWISTSNNRIDFYNLREGEYTLELRMALSNLNTYSPVTTLHITILPPWWCTTWMYAAYIFIALLAIAALVLRICHKQQKQKEEFAQTLEQQKLKELYQMRKQLFVNISHELKTPLSLIISPLQELYGHLMVDKQSRKCIDLAYENANRLNRLITQLISFSKDDNSQLTLRISQGNLYETIYQTYAAFLHVAEAKKIKYHFQAESDCRSEQSSFDSYIVEHTITNLLSNAFKFTPSGGNITLSLRTNLKYGYITVQDSGTGISKEKELHIFDRYYTTLSDAGGTGIGLAFTHELVSLHQGEITVESSQETGSCFNIRIPLTLPINTEKKEAVSVPPKKGNYLYDHETAFTSIAGFNMLVVDDNVEMATYLYDHYSKQNEVHVAYNATQAFEIIKNKKVDVIICDVMMPGIDGYALCKRVKNHLPTATIPFIFLTAMNGNDFIIKAIHAGADDYITKPFSLTVVNAKLESILFKSQTKTKAVSVLKKAANGKDMQAEFIEKATRIILSHINDPQYEIKDLALEMNLSVSRLRQKCMDAATMSLADFIRKVRLEKGVELLEGNQHNISEIAYMTGFSTPSYFSLCFRKEYGCSPSEYITRGFHPDSD